VPAVPSCLLEPIWVEFCALIGGERPAFDPGHPLGCHRRRVSDRVVFEHVVAALVHGSGYERVATVGCSDRTIRRRLKTWAAAGIARQVHALALRAYDQMIGLELGDLAVDGCITKAPCGGECAGPSPVDRRKGGLKRSVATENYGIPLGIAAAGANRHDSPLLACGCRKLCHLMRPGHIRGSGHRAGRAAAHGHTHFLRVNRFARRRILVQRSVWPVGVVVIGVLTKDEPQMPFTGDQHPVQALAAGAADPALGDRVRARRQDRRPGRYALRWR
jgi:hypothetical protein